MFHLPTALPLPTSLSTIVSLTSITPTDTMTTTSPAALTTVSTVSTSFSTPTIITEVDIPPHHTNEASNFSNESLPPLTQVSTMTVPINIPKNHYNWSDYDDYVFEKKFNVIYNIMVYWKKNVFMLPAGRAGKDYIDEITRLLNTWIQDSAIKHNTFKAIMVMSSSILKKPSRNSKAKDHSEALQQNMVLRQSGDLLQLFKETGTIQKGIKDSTKPKSIAQLSKKFVEHMNKGNINSAIKLLSNNMENDVLPLNDTTLNLLKQKHPCLSEADKDFLFDDIPQSIHKTKYECIDAEVIRNTALRTKGWSGP